MTNLEIEKIVNDCKQLLPPQQHKIRELPGGGLWCYVSHHDYRERLDQVWPEWQSLYSDIQEINGDAVIKCSINIMGISKQAIAGVPLAAPFGGLADRLAAKAFKNACEAWGIGRYLDDQVAVFEYLNKNLLVLLPSTRKKLPLLAKYLKIDQKNLLPQDQKPFNSSNESSRKSLVAEIFTIKAKMGISDQKFRLLMQATAGKEDPKKITVDELIKIKSALLGLCVA